MLGTIALRIVNVFLRTMFSYYYYSLNFLCLCCYLNVVDLATGNNIYFSTNDSFDYLKKFITSPTETTSWKSNAKPTIGEPSNSSFQDKKSGIRIKKEAEDRIPLNEKNDFSKKAQPKIVNKRDKNEGKLSAETVLAFQTSSSISLSDFFKDLTGRVNNSTSNIMKNMSKVLNSYSSSSFKKHGYFKENEINVDSFHHDYYLDVVTAEKDLTPEDRYPNYIQNKDKTVHVGTNSNINKRLPIEFLKNDSGLSESEWYVKTNGQDGTNNNIGIEIQDDKFTTVKAYQEIIYDPTRTNVTLNLKVFGEKFKAFLDVLKIGTFMPNAQVTIHDNENTKNISLSSLKNLYLYEGSLDSKNSSYVCGSIVDSYFIGVLMLGNGTVWYVEHHESENVIEKSPVSNETDISFKRCTYSNVSSHNVIYSGCKQTGEKITCFEGSSELKEKINSTTRVSLSDDTKSHHFPSDFPKNASCAIEITSDPSHFVKVHNESVVEALREILIVILQANRVLNQVDFDGDGRPENLSLMIGHAAMYKSYKEEVLDDKESIMDQKLNTFLNHKQNGCLSLLLLSENLKPEEPISITYGGGVCQNSQNETRPPTNVAVINLIGPKHRSRALLPMSLRVTETIGEMIGSFGEECEAPALDSSGDSWHSFFPECSRRSMIETLSKQSFCLEPHHEHHAQELKVGQNAASDSRCGNGIVDSGEECDCGNECQKNYSCCVPTGKKNECHYDRSKGHECEWSEPCCTMSCKFIPKEWKNFCGSGDPSCGPKGAYCNGSSSSCPDHLIDPKASDGHRCGPGNFEQVGAGTCKDGRCDSTICRDAGLEDCRCEHQSQEKCKVCCKKNGKDQRCLLWKDFGLKSNASNFFYRYPGLPCSTLKNEFCDAKGTCTSKLSGSSNAAIFYSKLIGKGMPATALVAWTVLWRVMCIRLV